MRPVAVWPDALGKQPEQDEMKIQFLQAKALILLKLESRQQLTEKQRFELVELSDQLWALGSRLPDNVGETPTIVQAFVALRQFGYDAAYAIHVAKCCANWHPRRFETAYPYSAEHLGVASWQYPPRRITALEAP